MKIVVDTREKEKLYNYLMKHYPDVKWERYALPRGDYESERCIVERKSIADLSSSVISDKRLTEQMERLATVDDKVVVLLVTGNVETYLETCRPARLPEIVDEDFIKAVVASYAYRYGITVLWIENERRAFDVMVKFMSKVDEGKWLVPSRYNYDILMTRLLKLKSHEWSALKSKFTSPIGIANATESELQSIYGIGPAKAKRILNILNQGIE